MKPATPAPHWHAEDTAQVMQHWQSSDDGLSQHAAAERLQRYGRNSLPQPAAKSLWLRFVLQFHNLLIYVLLAAAVTTALKGKIANFKVPKRFILSAELPLLPIGKIDKRALAEDAGEPTFDQGPENGQTVDLASHLGLDRGRSRWRSTSRGRMRLPPAPTM